MTNLIRTTINYSYGKFEFTIILREHVTISYSFNNISLTTYLKCYLIKQEYPRYSQMNLIFFEIKPLQKNKNFIYLFIYKTIFHFEKNRFFVNTRKILMKNSFVYLYRKKIKDCKFKSKNNYDVRYLNFCKKKNYELKINKINIDCLNRGVIFIMIKKKRLERKPLILTTISLQLNLVENVYISCSQPIFFLFRSQQLLTKDAHVLGELKNRILLEKIKFSNVMVLMSVGPFNKLKEYFLKAGEATIDFIHGFRIELKAVTLEELADFIDGIYTMVKLMLIKILVGLEVLLTTVGAYINPMFVKILVTIKTKLVVVGAVIKLTLTKVVTAFKMAQTTVWATIKPVFVKILAVFKVVLAKTGVIIKPVFLKISTAFKVVLAKTGAVIKPVFLKISIAFKVVLAKTGIIMESIFAKILEIFKVIASKIGIGTQDLLDPILEYVCSVDPRALPLLAILVGWLFLLSLMRFVPHFVESAMKSLKKFEKEMISDMMYLVNLQFVDDLLQLYRERKQKKKQYKQ